MKDYKHRKQTAEAWGLSTDELDRLYVWLERVPEHYRWRVFRNLLQKHYMKKVHKKAKSVRQVKLL